MTAIFQRCVVCGYERQNAPSALPTCCNMKLIVIAEADVGSARKPRRTRVAAGPCDFSKPRLARTRVSKPDTKAILRAKFGYDLPEVHKLGHYDELA